MSAQYFFLSAFFLSFLRTVAELVTNKRWLNTKYLIKKGIQFEREHFWVSLF